MIGRSDEERREREGLPATRHALSLNRLAESLRNTLSGLHSTHAQQRDQTATTTSSPPCLRTLKTRDDGAQELQVRSPKALKALLFHIPTRARLPSAVESLSLTFSSTRLGTAFNTRISPLIDSQADPTPDTTPPHTHSFFSHPPSPPSPPSFSPLDTMICTSCGADAVVEMSEQAQTVCTRCGTVVSQNAIVSEITFGETSGGAAMVQGSYVGNDQSTSFFRITFSVAAFPFLFRRSRSIADFDRRQSRSFS
jgi:hypothetical protein